MECTDTSESIREEMTTALVQEPNANDMDKILSIPNIKKAAKTKTSLQLVIQLLVKSPHSRQFNTPVGFTANLF